eukprot:758232-Hanusia_phi.AAC.4
MVQITGGIETVQIFWGGGPRIWGVLDKMYGSSVRRVGTLAGQMVVRGGYLVECTGELMICTGTIRIMGVGVSGLDSSFSGGTHGSTPPSHELEGGTFTTGTNWDRQERRVGSGHMTTLEIHK